MAEHPHKQPLGSPISFAEAFALNEGTLIEPLAAGTPVDAIDPSIVHGIAGLSRNVIESTIKGYAGSYDEVLRFKGRYREIRGLANASLSSYELAPETPAKTIGKKEVVAPKDQYQMTLDMVLRDPENPATEMIPAIVAVRPKDPETVYEIERAFADTGIDMSKPGDQLTERDEKIIVALGKGIEKYVFRKSTQKEIQEFCLNWLGSVDKAPTLFSRNFQLTAVEQSIIYFMGKLQNIDEYNDFIRAASLAQQAFIARNPSNNELLGRIHTTLHRSFISGILQLPAYLQDAIAVQPLLLTLPVAFKSGLAND